MSMGAKPSSIAIIMQPELRFFLIALARRIKEETGAKLHAYVSTQQEIDFYSAEGGAQLFDSIINSEAHFRDPPKEPDNTTVYEEAREWERRIGTTFALLAVGNRHFGRGYALAGPGHPRSRFSESWDIEKMTRSYVWSCRFWECEFSQKKFDLVVNGTAIVGRMARRHNVPFRFILGARTENLHYWAHDEFFHTPAVEQRFNALPADDGGYQDLTRPYLIEREHRQKFVRSDSLFRLILRLGKMALTRLYHHLRRYEKARGYYLIENMRYAVSVWRETRRMMGPMTVELDTLKGKPFIFFPLHTEPEASVGQISPEFFFQHAAIAALSRDMPSGVVLAVKETIHGVGRRPVDFYRQVADLKNVVWLNMMEYGLEVSRHATAVATITGTAGMEAAVMGKPVIAFGHHNLYNFLPHVFAPSNLDDLSGPIGEIMEGRLDLDRARRDGARYLRAVRDVAFDMREYNYIDRTRFDPQSVADAFDALFASLRFRAQTERPIS